MFRMITNHKLSPNQFYLLCSIRDNIGTEVINIHQDLRQLILYEWIDSTYKPTQKALDLVNKIDSLFKAQKRSTRSLPADFSDNIDKYISLFPNIKLPNGKRARSDKKNLEPRFRWFFDNYDHDWATVLKATAAYIDEYERKNYMYMRTSQYFIYKTESDKTTNSDLADYCAAVKSGEDLSPGTHFPEKVV